MKLIKLGLLVIAMSSNLGVAAIDNTGWTCWGTSVTYCFKCLDAKCNKAISTTTTDSGTTHGNCKKENGAFVCEPNP